VLRGILGAGYHGVLRASKWALVEHVPIIVEIVDSSQKIAAFVAGTLDETMSGGMATLERAAVIMHRRRAATGGGAKESAENEGGAASMDVRLAQSLKPLATLPKIEPGAHMTMNENGVLLRVFIGESDRLENKPLYEVIVQKVR